MAVLEVLKLVDIVYLRGSLAAYAHNRFQRTRSIFAFVAEELRRISDNITNAPTFQDHQFVIDCDVECPKNK